MHRVRLIRWLTYLVCAVAIAITVGMTHFHLWSPCADSTAPPPEFIAAAMKDQEKPGMALEVQYSWKSTGTIGQTHPVEAEIVRERYYVRTPKVIFLREKVTRDFAPTADTSNLYTANYTTTRLYNRSTGQYRELTERDDGLPPEGINTHNPGLNTLPQMTTVESVIGYFGSASLYSLVEHGAVLEKKKIDNHDCWGVAYDVPGVSQRHVIWVDPSIGFCPRRIELVTNDHLRRRKTMRLYTELANGVWFPKEVVYEEFSKAGELTTSRTIEVADARLVPLDEHVKLRIEFPPGTVLDSDEEQGK